MKLGRTTHRLDRKSNAYGRGQTLVGRGLKKKPKYRRLQKRKYQDSPEIKPIGKHQIEARVIL